MENINDNSITIIEQIEIAKTILKDGLLELTDNMEIQELITERINCISVNILERKKFLEIAEVDPKSSNIPGAFYYNNNVYLCDRGTFDKKDFHELVHEMLHSISDNFKTDGKTGLTQYYYDENDKLDAIGHVINEAATEYLTAYILNDAFYGYTNDLNYILQIILCIMNVDIKELVNLYFQKGMWLDEENNKRFNTKNVGLLTDVISEYDNRLPRYKKKEYNFDFIFSSILDAINCKLLNSENIDLIKIHELLKNIYNYHDWIEIKENTIQKYNTIVNKINNMIGNLDKLQENLLQYDDTDFISASIKRQ